MKFITLLIKLIKDFIYKKVFFLFILADALFKLGNIEESYKWYYEVLMKEETDVMLICDKG